MFVQVIRAHVTDESGLKTQWKRWVTDIKPGAIGFLGSTAGVADDGTLIAMARFASEDDARRNGMRDEQTQWWLDTAKCLDGDIEFQDCTRTDQWNKGGSDSARFVQIRQGVSSDPARLRDLYVNQQPVRMGPVRPEVLGGLFAWHGDNGFTVSAYFTSEAAARGGESLDEFKPFFDDMNAVMQDMIYLDLRDPWFS
jgi:hypothetical protein